MQRRMYQEAPYPEILERLVSELQVWGHPKMAFSLEEKTRWNGPYNPETNAYGLTLVVTLDTESAHRDHTFHTVIPFDVPAINYSQRAWTRWLFDRMHDVVLHELMEGFCIGGERPFLPLHSPGANRFVVTELDTAAEKDLDYRGLPVPSAKP